MSSDANHLAHVVELFQISGRGVIVVTDVSYSDWPADARAGRPLEICNRVLPSVLCDIVGIEHCGPFDPNRTVALLLPPHIGKGMVEIGAELRFPVAA